MFQENIAILAVIALVAFALKRQDFHYEDVFTGHDAYMSEKLAEQPYHAPAPKRHEVPGLPSGGMMRPYGKSPDGADTRFPAFLGDSGVSDLSRRGVKDARNSGT